MSQEEYEKLLKSLSDEVGQNPDKVEKGLAEFQPLEQESSYSEKILALLSDRLKILDFTRMLMGYKDLK